MNLLRTWACYNESYIYAPYDMCYAPHLVTKDTSILCVMLSIAAKNEKKRSC